MLNPQRSEAGAAWTARLADRTDLTAVVDTGRLAIFVQPATAWVPIGASGAVIGDLRAAGSATKIERLTAAPPEALGRRLVHDCWGDYIAIAQHADASGTASIFAARLTAPGPSPASAARAR